MGKYFKYGWRLLLLQLTFGYNCLAQDITVHDILLSGNVRTRASIILRELSFRSGETFSRQELAVRLRDAEEQLINTSLFHTVAVHSVPFDSSSVNIIVDVRERWYIFPMIIFKPVDRNLNQWLVEKKGDMGRVNYGVKLSYNNMTGVNDKFRASFMTGYTRQISLSYNRFYFDRKMRWGIMGAIAFGKAHELNYNTVNDKQVFLKEDTYVRSFTNATIGLTYRKALHTRHSFGINFTSEVVSDTIVSLNPQYFHEGRNSIGFPTLFYSFDYLDLDYNSYPTQGYAARINFSKSGLNKTVDLWQFNVKGAAYYPINSRSFIQTSVYAGIKLPFRQPWFAQRFLGYGDVYLQGYEYYVIDGAAGGYIRTSLAQQLFSRTFPSPHIKKRLTGERIPFRIYGKVYLNGGYVYNPDPGNNTLSNKFLFSGGLGLDIITIYDLVVKLEWSFNQLGQNGLFLHPKSIF